MWWREDGQVVGVEEDMQVVGVKEDMQMVGVKEEDAGARIIIHTVQI